MIQLSPTMTPVSPDHTSGHGPALPPLPDAARLPLPRKLVFGDRSMRLRPLNVDDEDQLIGFFNSHSSETIRQRYGYLLTHMSHDRAHHLLTLDPARGIALGLFETAGAEQPLLAVGRCLFDDDGRGGEIAFVVRETCRRLGLAAELCLTLRAHAHARGLARLEAQVQSDNAPMLALLMKFGARFHFPPETGLVEATLELA